MTVSRSLFRPTLSFAEGRALFQRFALGLSALAFLPVAGAGIAAAQDADAPELTCGFEQIIDLRTRTPMTATSLLAEASATQLVFLGEERGVTEHIELAACIVDAKAGGRPPVLAMEHLPADTQSFLDQWRRDTPFDTDLLADGVGWETLGWPRFNLYRPLFEVVGEARAHLVATNLPRPGGGGLSADALLEVAPPYGLQTEEIAAAWVPDLITAHCDLIDEEGALRMALAQMERDQIMAGRLIAGRGRGVSTLFLGDRSHIRYDRSIPYLIGRTDRPPSMLAIAAFAQSDWSQQVEAEGPALLNDLATQFDVVVVAGEPEEGMEDPCAAMRALMGGGESN